MIFNEALEMLDDEISVGSQWLSVPVVGIIDVGEEFALVRLSNNSCWFALGDGGFVEGLAQLLDIVAIDNDRIEAERVQ